MTELLRQRSWPELVFHVLAHVEASARLPASVFDASYVDWVASRLGVATDRMLGEDAAVLGRVLPTHPLLARAQLLAWLFDDVEQASACAARDLSELDPGVVTRPELLPPLVALGAPIEVLRCAAELEREVFAELPPVETDARALLAAVAKVEPAAPSLAAAQLCCLRSLCLRGRVRGREIFVGVPCLDASAGEIGPGLEHVAWQAAHEATVAEIEQRERASARGGRAVERAALALLAERAAAADMADAHGRGLSHLAT